MNVRFPLLFTVLTLLSLNLFGQMDHPVKWDFKVKYVEEDTYDVIATAKIMNGWYIYSKDIDEAKGPLPTNVNLNESSVSLVGKVNEIGEKIEFIQPETNQKLTRIANRARYTQRVKLTNQPDEIQGVVSFMSCTKDQCLPPQEIPFSIDVQ